MGAVYIAMGDFASAVQCHEQHLDIAKEQGDKREEARAYSNLGSAYHYRRDFDKAASYHARVLELAQELQERAIEMRAYAGLGHAARCMQDLERAKQHHEQQLNIAENLKDRAAEGRASSNLGELPFYLYWRNFGLIAIKDSRWRCNKLIILFLVISWEPYDLKQNFFFLWNIFHPVWMGFGTV